ncbi:MAG: glutamine amidotransferase [Actinomycetaceae bacterium]|nr:glutamine amidotransferase [Actinomycetaceae bacterium]
MSDLLRIGVILPETMGAYGDGGNAVVLAKRLEKRGFGSEVVTVHVGEEVPATLDFYLLGGSEDAAQALAAEQLKGSRAMREAVEAGAVVLAVCAGFEVLGEWYEDADGRRVEGASLLDVRTTFGEQRLVGELASKPLVAGLGEHLTGFENHLGRTQLGADAQPLGSVLHGHGNGVLEGEHLVDGAVAGRVFATYMHGPVLARNPEFADHLISLATGVEALEPIDSAATALLRKQRLEASGISPN